MTMKQLHQSLEMMRNACMPKTNAPIGTKTLTLFMEIKKKWWRKLQKNIVTFCRIGRGFTQRRMARNKRDQSKYFQR